MSRPHMQITLAEFASIRRLMVGSLKEDQKLTVKIGPPDKATDAADRVRCPLCKKQAWDCRC